MSVCGAKNVPSNGIYLCGLQARHDGQHHDINGRGSWGADALRPCGDCAVAPGQVHQAGCDVERCSYCGGQWIQCGHSRTRKHDPRFARWTGLYPGYAEAELLGLDLNEFHARGLSDVFFVKPTR